MMMMMIMIIIIVAVVLFNPWSLTMDPEPILGRCEMEINPGWDVNPSHHAYTHTFTHSVLIVISDVRGN